MAKKKKLAKTFMTWLLVILMVGSAFGVMLGSYSSSQRKYTYEGQKFIATQTGFKTAIDGLDTNFRYYPGDVDHINLSEDMVNKIIASYELDMTYDEDSAMRQQISLLQYEISDHVQNFFDVYSVNGLTAENKFNLTVINCDENSTVPTLYFVSSNRTEFEELNKCLLFKSDSFEGFQVLKDRFLYGMHRIIK